MNAETQKSELVLINQMSKEEFGKVVLDLIRTNGEVRQAIINLVCACPNVLTEIQKGSQSRLHGCISSSSSSSNPSALISTNLSGSVSRK